MCSEIKTVGRSIAVVVLYNQFYVVYQVRKIENVFKSIHFLNIIKPTFKMNIHSV